MLRLPGTMRGVIVSFYHKCQNIHTTLSGRYRTTLQHPQEIRECDIISNMVFRLNKISLAGFVATTVFSTAAALTTVAEINALPRERHVMTEANLEGTVTGRADSGYAFNDKTGDIIVLDAERNRCVPGDRVRFAVQVKIDSLGNLYVTATNVTVLSHGNAPDVATVTSADINSGRYVCRPVRVKGTVVDMFRDEIDPLWNWLYLQDSEGRMVVSFRPSPDKRMDTDSLLDAEVVVTGICNSGLHGFRRFLGTRVEVPAPGDIRITVPASPDPFDAPPLKSVNDLIRQVEPIDHRRRIAGHVIATWNGDRLLLGMNDDRNVRVQLRHPVPLPPCGASVSVSGFVRKNAFYITIVEAFIRNEPGQLPKDWKSRTVTARKILFAKTGENRIDPSFDGRIIRMTGIVRNISTLRPGQTHIGIEDDGYMVTVDIGNVMPPEIGSTIEVTGACLMDVEPDEGGTKFGRIKGFSVITRTPEDIKILARPSWWTPRRLFAVITILLAALGAIVVWNHILRRIVERRSRALLKSEVAKISAELRIDERTHLAVELHDSLAQNLTGVSLQIAAAQTAQRMDQPAASRHLETADRMLRSCRTELRRCIWDLRGEALEEHDFAKAVAKTLHPVSGTAKVSVRTFVPRSRLSDSTAHAVLRILRELTSNAVRHGKATHVRVAGELRNGRFRFSVQDDGCGFSIDHCPGPDLGHFGLDGIRERIKRLDGKVSVESSPGNGTYARFEFGLAPSVEERNSAT